MYFPLAGNNFYSQDYCIKYTVSVICKCETILSFTFLNFKSVKNLCDSEVDHFPAQAVVYC
jgi:hypothetical protein